ncbi:Hypothetical protein GbCGDNIH6_2369 [Granulibacter bethesdensis]|nr:Hypothetical protein GbCGDNIH6_2369 [Granulibacter bethesdensis]
MMTRRAWAISPGMARPASSMICGVCLWSNGLPISDKRRLRFRAGSSGGGPCRQGPLAPPRPQVAIGQGWVYASRAFPVAGKSGSRRQDGMKDTQMKRNGRRIGSLVALAVMMAVSGCSTHSTPPRNPLVALPGPYKSLAEYRSDGKTCREKAGDPALLARLPASEPKRTYSYPDYLTCMQEHGNVLMAAGYVAAMMKAKAASQQPAASAQPAPPAAMTPPMMMGGGMPTYSGFNDYYPWLTGEDVVNGVGYF